MLHMSMSTAMAARGLTDTAVAGRLGLSDEAVRLWRVDKRTVTAERALEIEAKLGIPRHEVRPDLWDAPGA